MNRLFCLFVVLAACGGSSAPATATPPTGTAKTGKATLTPELTAFHDVLSPIWHAEGPARMKDACAALPDFARDAQAVKASATPAAVDADKWKQAGLELEASVTGLQTACQGDEPAFTVAFTAVHDAYHHAMELIVGKHEKGDAIGEHHGEGEHMNPGHEAGAGHGGDVSKP